MDATVDHEIMHMQGSEFMEELRKLHRYLRLHFGRWKDKISQFGLNVPWTLWRSSLARSTIVSCGD